MKDADRDLLRALQRARALLARRADPPRLPVLLARRRGSADPVRAAGLVHPHHRARRARARQQPRDPLAARAHPGRPLRRLPAQQRRLGALARALLGHAAQHLGERRRPGAWRRRRRVAEILERNPRRLRRTSTRRARRIPTLSPHLLVHKPWIDQVTWTRPGRARRLPPRARGDRLLVRLGLHAVRAVGLPAPRPRASSSASFPADFISRGDRPDARLVLLAALDLDAALPGARRCPHPVQDLHRARPRRATARARRSRRARATTRRPR